MASVSEYAGRGRGVDGEEHALLARVGLVREPPVLHARVVQGEPVARPQLEGVGVLPAKLLDLAHQLLRESRAIGALQLARVGDVPPDLLRLAGDRLE